jgi:predicted phosphodiesterase
VKIALFGDVHGNLSALEVFLAHTRDAVDQYICLGDVVNYGPYNDECLDLIASLPGIILLAGNHEQIFLGLGDPECSLDLVKRFTETSMHWFSQEDRLRTLGEVHALGSFTCRHTIDGMRIFRDSELSVDQSYIIGHSHYQFERQCDVHRILNPGSVGQNRDRISRVEWAVFDTDTETVLFRSEPYDVEQFIDELRARSYPAECVGYYERKLREERRGFIKHELPMSPLGEHG